MRDDEYEAQRKVERDAAFQFIREHSVVVPRELGETLESFAERADRLMAPPPPVTPEGFVLAEMRAVAAEMASEQIVKPVSEREFMRKLNRRLRAAVRSTGRRHHRPSLRPAVVPLIRVRTHARARRRTRSVSRASPSASSDGPPPEPPSLENSRYVLAVSP